MRIHPVVNISCVKPYRDRLPGQPVSAPGPSNVTEDCDEEYEVDYVVDSWYKGKRLEYLVHWKGWSDTDCTWELVSNLGNAAAAVRDFHATHPSAPHCLRGISPFDFLQQFHYVGLLPPVTLLSVAHAPPAMVFFFLFLFAPLFATFILTVYIMLCKPGCAVSTADTSSV